MDSSKPILTLADDGTVGGEAAGEITNSEDEYQESEEFGQREQQRESKIQGFFYDNIDLNDKEDEMPEFLYANLAGTKRKSRGVPPERSRMIQKSLIELHFPQEQKQPTSKLPSSVNARGSCPQEHTEAAAKGPERKTKGGRVRKSAEEVS